MGYWDPIRLQSVKASPEETVRQKWIHAMIHSLGYPKSLLAVEKEIASLPHRKGLLNLNRRFDLLCYRSSPGELAPLLLVEFKAKKRGKESVMQLFGYNEAVGAPFLCVIEGNEAQTFWREKEQIHSVPFLPTYFQLLEHRSNDT